MFWNFWLRLRHFDIAIIIGKFLKELVQRKVLGLWKCYVI
jgi:hypothetical protein